MVGDGYAMGVAAQILKYVFGAAKRSFGIHHPVVPEQGPQPRSKSLWLSERLQFSMEIEMAIVESTPEGRDKLSAEEAAEHLYRKKECVV